MSSTDAGSCVADVPASDFWECAIQQRLFVTGDVLGLDFRRVPEVRGWHPSVELYEIRDRASGEPMNAAGSSSPQWAMIGCPGQNGHSSRA